MEHSSGFEKTPNVEKIIQRLHAHKRRPFGEIMSEIKRQGLGLGSEAIALASEEYMLNILQETMTELKAKNQENLNSEESEVLQRGTTEFEETKRELLLVLEGFVKEAEMELEKITQKHQALPADSIGKDTAFESMKDWKEEVEARKERFQRVTSAVIE